MYQLLLLESIIEFMPLYIINLSAERNIPTRCSYRFNQTITLLLYNIECIYIYLHETSLLLCVNVDFRSNFFIFVFIVPKRCEDVIVYNAQK